MSEAPTQEQEESTTPPTVPDSAGDRAGVRLGIFVGGVAVALIAGFTLAKVTSPASPTIGAQTGVPAGVVATDSSGAHQHGPVTSAGSEVGGLTVSSGGYTLVPAATMFGKPGSQQFSFTIKGPNGKAADKFAIVHEKDLHLVVVRRDLTGYQHLHPIMAPDGTWSVPVRLDRPGLWRAYADFTVVNPAGAQLALTLGADLTVAGDYQPKSLPAAAKEATEDNLTATYEGYPAVGATQPMLFRVTSAGSPVTLQPYLGSFGHLVVIRQGDLAYLHVHPDPQFLNGVVKFWLAAPSVGTYRMFFDHQVDGKVHTAEFTLEIK
jgi:hypothetical protein